MIAEQNDVELISIKIKSLKDLDSGVNSNTIRENNHCDNSQKLSNDIENNTEHFIDNDEEQNFDDDDDDDDDDHYESSVRFIKVDKSPNGICGFHLTRTKWDPYPWVSAVDNFTTAAKSDLKAGDCVLEVNGCDVLGLRITEIAKLVKSSQHQVTLLLWSTNCNTKCDEESLCAAPMPRTLQRLSLVVQTVLSLIECPVCRDTITPPAMQCQNGHLLCVSCRIRAEKCPICRDRYYPRPALIAEQIQMAITSAFNLCRNEDKVRQKIFGRHNRQRYMVKTTLQHLKHQKQQQQHEIQEVHKSLQTDAIKQQQINSDGKLTDKFFNWGSGNRTTCHKLLRKLLTSKVYSIENLENSHNNNLTRNTCKKHFNICNTPTPITAASSQTQLLFLKDADEQVGKPKNLFKKSATQQQTHTNQLNDLPRIAVSNHYLLTSNYKSNFNDHASIENMNLNLNSKLCCQQIVNNKMQLFSISTNDLLKIPTNITCLLDTNKSSKISSPVVEECEASYVTIPRATKLKKNYGESIKCHHDIRHNACRDSCGVTTNLFKSTSTSISALNLSSTMSLPVSTPGCCCCCKCYRCQYSALKSSSSSIPKNCQPLLSASASASDFASFLTLGK